MKKTTLYPLSLLVILLACGAAPTSPGWRALAGGLLFSLWLFSLARGSRLVGYLPGHALLFFGLARVTPSLLWAWFPLPALSLALELTHPKNRFFATLLYVILWADIFALVHQLVAQGRALAGAALWAWSGVVFSVGFPFLALGAWRTWSQAKLRTTVSPGQGPG